MEGLKNDVEIGDFGARVLWDIYTSAKRSPHSSGRVGRTGGRRPLSRSLDLEKNLYMQKKKYTLFQKVTMGAKKDNFK